MKPFEIYTQWLEEQDLQLQQKQTARQEQAKQQQQVVITLTPLVIRAIADYTGVDEADIKHYAADFVWERWANLNRDRSLPEFPGLVLFDLALPDHHPIRVKAEIERCGNDYRVTPFNRPFSVMENDRETWYGQTLPEAIHKARQVFVKQAHQCRRQTEAVKEQRAQVTEHAADLQRAFDL